MIQHIANKVATAFGHESRLVSKLRPAYELGLNLISLGSGATWSINGLRCRIDARCRTAMGQSYDPEVAALLSSRIPPGATCFDVGANLGVYVLQFAEWSKPNGRVVAFEPNPTTLQLLKRHVAMNELRERVTVVGEAVSDTSGNFDFYFAGCDGMSRLGAPNPLVVDRVQAISIPVTTIDGYVNKSGFLPDVMLVDVEGFEMKVLAGARRTLARRRDMILIVEMHPQVWDSAGTDRDAAEVLLAELGLSIHPLVGQRDAFEEHGLVELRPVDKR